MALYGDLTWAPLMLAASIINIVLIWLVNIYLRHFKIGPVEWVWRSMVEWRRPRFRTRSSRNPSVAKPVSV